MLRGRDVQELKELQRQGMSIQAISKLTGWDRKTIRKYIQAAGLAPEYGPRSAPPSKLDGFKPYLEERLRAGVWNARVLLRELRERNYAGSYTILTDWLRPQRSATRVVAVRRFETAPGKQAQVDWGHLGTLEMAGQEQKLHCFTFTLGYSRRMVAEAALDQKLGTLLRLHAHCPKLLPRLIHLASVASLLHVSTPPRCSSSGRLIYHRRTCLL